MRTEVPYIEDEKGWCTISYYEENKRFGDSFCGKFFIVIDFSLRHDDLISWLYYSVLRFDYVILTSFLNFITSSWLFLYLIPSSWVDIPVLLRHPKAKYWILARVNHIRIDGSQGPSDGSRFCLGKISNPNRKQDITMVRHKLGNGIDLIYEMGVVKLENLSEREFLLAWSVSNFLIRHDFYSIGRYERSAQARPKDCDKNPTRSWMEHFR